MASGDSVDTSLAGFEIRRRPQPRGGRIAIPAALKYALAVSRRMPVASSIRRSGHPRRPRARTCCRFSSLKTLAIPATGPQSPSPAQRPSRSPIGRFSGVDHWPVLGVDRGSARTWEHGPLPSQTKEPRSWRTRADPFARSGQPRCSRRWRRARTAAWKRRRSSTPCGTAVPSGSSRDSSGPCSGGFGSGARAPAHVRARRQPVHDAHRRSAPRERCEIGRSRPPPPGLRLSREN